MTPRFNVNFHRSSSTSDLCDNISSRKRSSKILCHESNSPPSHSCSKQFCTSVNTADKDISVNTTDKDISVDTAEKDISVNVSGKEISVNTTGNDISVNTTGKDISVNVAGKDISVHILLIAYL